MGKIKTKMFTFFSLKHFFSEYFILLFIILSLINTIHSIQTDLSRDDTSPQLVAPRMLELINEYFKGKKGKDNIYKKNLGDYSLEMKFLNFYLKPEEIVIDKYSMKDRFFSYSEIYTDIIFSLKLTKKENNFDNNGVYIKYNSNSSNLSFNLKNIYSGLYIKYIEFEKQPNNTYKHQTTAVPVIDINKNTFRYPEKIKRFLIDNENELKLFLYESFNRYLTSITNKYPKADGILLYETIKEYINTYNTFCVSPRQEYNNKKIVFNEFKEEEIYVENGNIVFSNILVKFDIILEGNYYKSYQEILPNITYQMNEFFFNSIHFKIEVIDNLELSEILKNIFSLIINFYNNDY